MPGLCCRLATDHQIADAIQHMIEQGDLDLATRIAFQVVAQYAGSSAVTSAYHHALSLQRQKYQEIDPFRFIVYSEALNAPVPKMHPVTTH